MSPKLLISYLWLLLPDQLSLSAVVGYILSPGASKLSAVMQMYSRVTCIELWAYYSVSVSQKIPHPEGSSHFSFFSQTVEIFNRFFTHLLHVPIYARLQIFIQLSLILTKLCHIKRDYPVHTICSKCPPTAETHALTHLRKSLIALLIVVSGK